MRVRVCLDTLDDVKKFVEITNNIEWPIFIQDESGLSVSAKSLLGAIYTMEWDEVWCYCEKDISGKIFSFIV